MKISFDNKAEVRCSTQTMRPTIVKYVTDFVKGGKFSVRHAVDIICCLCFELSNYKEEGLALFPEVYLVSNESDIKELSPTYSLLRLGHAPIESVAIKALKVCGYLAQNGWSIYVTTSKESQFGIFRSSDSILSTSSFELVSFTPRKSPFVAIRNCRSNCVEVVFSGGHKLEIRFNFEVVDGNPQDNAVNVLSRHIALDVVPELKSAVESFVFRLISNALRTSHGSLIAVFPYTMGKVPDSFSDGVILSEVIDMGAIIRGYNKHKEIGQMLQLTHQASLLKSMIHSDGVTLIDSRFRVRGFRSFVQPSKIEKKHITQVGGARSRAFSVLEQRVGKSLTCAFYRSQDGQMKVKEV